MKKYLALALALVMILAVAIPAAADEIAVGSGDGYENSIPYTKNDIQVLVRLDTDGDGIADKDDEYPNNEDQLHVQISWENIEFVYNAEYNDGEGAWEDKDNFITVANYSGAAVEAVFSYTDNPENEADYDVEFSVRQIPVEDPETNAISTEERLLGATFDSATNTATLNRGYETCTWADIAINLTDGATVPTEDSKVAVGYISVSIAVANS